ncbi:MAG TPA: PEP-CTERM/exosortase system-associated acyltransferase [Stellaceae bacterium]|nr:PEP-CTERM/exosortase system-associated acyltransferase [Stellaceae bacterium]
MQDFIGTYTRYFDVVRADTPDRLDLAYRLRYQVYCVENQYEDSGRCPYGREIDEDDDRSVHTLLIHRQSGTAVGTARLILPQTDGERQLPIQRILGPAERVKFQRLPLDRTGEVSRFAISKEFRRRRDDGRYPDGGYPYPPSGCYSAERRLLPHITFGLLRGILRICREYEVSVIAALVEPALWRILSRLGLDFGRLGPLVEHHGVRQPCVAPLVDLLRGSQSQGSLLWEYWEKEAAPVIAAPGFSVIDGRVEQVELDLSD